MRIFYFARHIRFSFFAYILNKNESQWESHYVLIWNVIGTSLFCTQWAKRHFCVNIFPPYESECCHLRSFFVHVWCSADAADISDEGCYKWKIRDVFHYNESLQFFRDD